MNRNIDEFYTTRMICEGVRLRSTSALREVQLVLQITARLQILIKSKMIENNENVHDSGAPIDLTTPQVKAKPQLKRRSSFFNLVKPEEEAAKSNDDALAKYRQQKLEAEASRWATALREVQKRE